MHHLRGRGSKTQSSTRELLGETMHLNVEVTGEPEAQGRAGLEEVLRNNNQYI